MNIATGRLYTTQAADWGASLTCEITVDGVPAVSNAVLVRMTSAVFIPMVNVG